MSEFKTGDVVLLKCGGRQMAVDTNRECDSYIECVWHDEKGRPQREQYPAAALMLDKDADE